MAILTDERNNPIAAPLDIITGHDFIDLRPLTVLLGSLNAETIVELNGQTIVNVDARSAAFVGTLSLQATVDAVNWIDIPAVSLLTQAAIVNPVLSGASANIWSAHVGGFQAFRVRVTAYTSGNIDVGIRGSISALRPSMERPYPTTLWVTATAAANTGFTLTLPAAGVGLFHYITYMRVARNATAALAGTATLVYTTTNLPGSPAWSVGNAMAAGGTQIDIDMSLSSPLKSAAANTATTIVVPAAGVAVLTRANVGYFVGA